MWKDNLVEQGENQQTWFEHPGVLVPYLIIVNNTPAGFCLVGSGKFVTEDIDFLIYETFLLSPYRGKSVSYEAIHKVFDNHQGKGMHLPMQRKTTAEHKGSGTKQLKIIPKIIILREMIQLITCPK